MSLRRGLPATESSLQEIPVRSECGDRSQASLVVFCSCVPSCCEVVADNNKQSLLFHLTRNENKCLEPNPAQYSTLRCKAGFVVRIASIPNSDVIVQCVDGDDGAHYRLPITQEIVTETTCQPGKTPPVFEIETEEFSTNANVVQKLATRCLFRFLRCVIQVVAYPQNAKKTRFARGKANVSLLLADFPVTLKTATWKPRVTHCPGSSAA